MPVLLTVKQCDKSSAYKPALKFKVERLLKLPETLRNALNPRYIGRAISVLAGGQTIEEELYRVDFPFDGKMISAEATFVVGSEILIETRLLQEYRLQIDFVKRTVVLEKAVR